MKAFAKLTLAALAVSMLGTTTLFAGPGVMGPTNRAGARHIHPVKELTCDRMVVNRPPHMGGTAVVKCTPANKNTVACRMACR